MVANKKSLFVLFLLTAATFWGCKDKDVFDDDYVVVGRFFGFCMGESCIETYKITPSGLQEDSKDGYPNQVDFYEGDYFNLPGDDYNLAKLLRDSFPRQLLMETDTVFGCPDCADQGGYYLEIKNATEHRFWIIDKTDFNTPEYIRNYIISVDSIVDKLSY
jgi:hypothetical protein